MKIIDDRLKTTLDLVKESFEKNIISVLESRSVYGNSWTSRRMIYFTDRIASKVQRIKNIEDEMLMHSTETINSFKSGIEEELKDIISYAFFALIKITWLKMDENWVYRYFGAMKEDS
jgi:hypothetical protein